MKDCKSLLGISFDTGFLSHLEKHFLSKVTKDSLIKLKKRSEKIQIKYSEPREVSKLDLDRIYGVFIKNAYGGVPLLRKVFVSKRDLRNLAGCLTYEGRDHKLKPIVEMAEFKYVLDLLDINWSNSFFISLFSTLLRNWDLENSIVSEKLRTFLKNKVSSLKTRNRRINAIRTNGNLYFEHNGAMRFAKKIIEESSFTDLGMLTASRADQSFLLGLGLSKGLLFCSYFNEVLVSYTYLAMQKKGYERYIPHILSHLGACKNKKTSKRCFISIVKKIKNNVYDDMRKLILRASFELVGDPDNNMKWGPWENITDVQAKELEETRAFLNIQCSKEFINIFFNEINYDERRKAFWLKYASRATVKVFCDSQSVSRLKKDPRIHSFVESRLGTLIGGSRAAALLLFTGDYVLIEIGAGGNAFYAYKIENLEKNGLDKLKKALDGKNNSLSMCDLKRTRMHTIGYQNEEGRFIHGGDWEESLRYLLKLHVKI